MMLHWARQRQESLAISSVDTAPRWRAIDNLSIPVRLLGGTLQGFLDVSRTLVQLLRHRATVMHLTTSGSLAVFRDNALLSLARLFAVRSIYHIRMGRLPEIILRGGWEWKAMRFAIRLASRVAVLDETSERALAPLLPPGKVIRVPNAIDLQDLPIARSRPASISRKVLFLGWIIPTKGISELIESWKIVGGTDWELEIAGASSDRAREELLAKIRELPNVRFLGQLSKPEVWERLTGCDIFVLPTYTEGFPNVILEAMAAGKAILTTPVGAIPEMLDIDSAEPRGVCVPPKDPEALASGLKKLMSDSALRAVLGSRARQKVERAYDTNVVFAQWLDIWRSLSSAKANAADRTNVVRSNKEDPKRA